MFSLIQIDIVMSIAPTWSLQQNLKEVGFHNTKPISFLSSIQ